MENNCCQEIKCSIGSIEQRISPITFDGNTLVIDSNLQVAQTLTADNAVIENLSITNLNISSNIVPTEDLSYNLGSPTNWFKNLYVNDIYTSGGSLYVNTAHITATGDVLNLPPKTTINEYPVLNTSYFTFFSNSTTGFGYIRVGATNFGSSTNTYSFPFVAPRTIVITSLMLSYAIGSSGSITNATAYMDILDTNGNISFSGNTATIPSCTANTKRFAESTFEYTVLKGDSVGIYIGYDSSTASNATPIATIGYRLPKPTPIFSSPRFLGNPPLLVGHYHSSVSPENDPYKEEEEEKEEIIKSYGEPMTESMMQSRRPPSTDDQETTLS